MPLPSDSILLPFLKACIIHFLMFVLLLLSFHSTSAEKPLTISAPVIKATAVSSAAVEKLVRQQKQRIAAVSKAERDKKAKVRQIAKQKAAKKKRAALDKKNKKRAADKKLKREAELKRQQAAEKKRKKDAEEKRRLQKIADEKQAKIEAVSKATEHQRILTELEKYKAFIHDKISRNWIEPKQNGICVLRLKLTPSGFVIEVRELSGLASICRTAKAAVYKADPLPVPNDPKVFSKMRTIEIELDSQGN